MREANIDKTGRSRRTLNKLRTTEHKMLGRTVLSDTATETIQRRQPLSLSERREAKSRVPQKLSRFVVVYDHTGSKNNSENDEFWTSKPALAIIFFVTVAILFRETRMLLGVCAVFLFEASSVIFKWSLYIAQDPNLKECIDVTKKFIKFWSGHAEHALKKNDKARKAVAATFLKTSETTQHVASSYLSARQKVVARQRRQESARLLLHGRGS